MSISEMLLKSNPVPAKREMSMSEYNKLVDTNTKLIDKMKYQEEEIEELKIKYNIMKENAETLAKRIDKAINILELSSQNKGICTRPETDTTQSVLLILKGEDKE